MRVVVQRVRYARVRVNGALVAEIGPGLLVFAGFAGSDSPEVLSWMARKVVNLRVFPDEHGRMNRSLQEVGGELLVVSQFTLYGDVQRGFRPSFTDAAPPGASTHALRTLPCRMPPRAGESHRRSIFAR